MYLLHDLAGQVTRAEQVLTDQLHSVQSAADNVKRNLVNGRSHNSLGELQSRAASFDLAIGRLELAADTFSAAWRVFKPLTKLDPTDTPAEAIARSMVLDKISSSPRLSELAK